MQATLLRTGDEFEMIFTLRFTLDSRGTIENGWVKGLRLYEIGYGTIAFVASPLRGIMA